MTEHEHDHNHPHDAATQEEKPPQKVTVEDIGPARKRLTIELPESRIQQKIESTYQQLRDDAVIPGFRRGRAPRRLIERRFGTSVRSDVKGQIISEAYAQAVEDEKLQVIGQPDIKDVDQIELPESGPLTFQVEVEVAPQVELPAFEELAVTKRTAPVTDQNVESEIERYRERFGQMKPVENAEIEEGDFVQAHVRILAGQDASDEAELIEEHPDTYILVPGEDRQHRGHVAGIVVEELGEHLIGQQVGQTVTISMTGPAGHENEKIKGQPITLKIQL
ncbi:MAG TPA: trigger factor, partial [Phycisphaeraceae bacterium]